MIAEISQRWFLKKRKIFIRDNNVILQYSYFTKFNETTFPYEEIGAHKENYITQIKHIKILLRVSSYLAGITFFLKDTTEYLANAYIYFIILFFGIIAHHYITREKVWKIKLENNTYIILNKYLPNETEVNNFIEKLFEQRQKYLKETYLSININMAYEPQFRSLQWLRQIEAINGDEFNNLRKELDALFNTEKKSIGF